MVRSKRVNGKIQCNAGNFPKTQRMQQDIFDGQCFCEEFPPKEVYKCGAEGEKCSCNGISIFAKLTGEDPAHQLSFNEVLESGEFEFKRSKDSVRCDAQQFGGDFAPGYQKQCFCDDRTVHRVKHYRNKRDMRRNRDRLRKAREDEERIAKMTKERIEAAQALAQQIAAEQKAAEAEMKKANEAAKKAEAEAFAKAEKERAAAEKAANEEKKKADQEAHEDEMEAKKAEQALKKAEAEAAA